VSEAIPLLRRGAVGGVGKMFYIYLMDKEVITYINNRPIFINYISSLPSNPNLKDRSKNLRKAGNYTEVIFWKQVNRKQFHKIDFDRQRFIGDFIVDFYVKSLGLVIEIDGTVHNSQEDYDLRRDTFLTNLGLAIYRISYYRVLHDLDNVMIELEDFIIDNYSRNPTPPYGHPSEGGE